MNLQPQKGANQRQNIHIVYLLLRHCYAFFVRFFNEGHITSALQATQLMPFSNDKLSFEDPVLFGADGSIKLGSWDVQEQNDISKIHNRLQTLENERKRLEVCALCLNCCLVTIFLFSSRRLYRTKLLLQRLLLGIIKLTEVLCPNNSS